jgi:hypothetical protein
MTVAANDNPTFYDPRQFEWIPARDLTVDQRLQRECNPETVARIVNEFDWSRFEAITVTIRNGRYQVVEGQHRTLAVQAIDPSCRVACMILADGRSDDASAQLALNSVQGRRVHTAFEKWRLRYNSGHPHEIQATMVMDRLGVRVGQAGSAMTISAVATVRSIIHGGQFSPEEGARLLDRTLTTIIAAFPTHDHESNVSRWNSGILLAVAQTYVTYPKADQARLARALRVRPAQQWITLGKGARGEPAWMNIARVIAGEYNRGKKRDRIYE